MAISVAQRGATGSSGFPSSIATAFGSNNTLNNAIIVVGFIEANFTNFGISDSQGNSYSSVLSNYNATDGLGFEVWIAYGIKAGANTVTLTTGYNAANMHIYEVAGLAASAAFDVNNYQYQTGATSLTSNSATTNHANELLLGASAVLSVTPAYTLGSGYSNLNAANGTVFHSASEEQIVSSTGSYAATFSLNTNVTYTVTVLATFADTSSSGPLSVSVSDSTTTSESIFINTFRVNVSDSTTTSESTSLLVTSYINTSDSTTTSESEILLVTNFVSVSDSTTTSEKIDVLRNGARDISVSDSSVTSEAIALSVGLLVLDSTTTSESVTVLIPLLFSSVSDSTTTSENVPTPQISYSIPVQPGSTYFINGPKVV